MLDILFSQKIPKGTNIVIYGANITGFCFYEQIRAVNHCKVIAFVDQKPMEDYQQIPVYHPLWLAENADKFDYILLGTLNEKAVFQIKHKLLVELQIPEEKVICDDYVPFLTKAGFINLANAAEAITVLERFGNSEEISGQCIKYIVDEIISHQEKYAAFLSRLKEYFFDVKQSFKSRILYAYILLQTGNGDENICRKLFECMQKNVFEYPTWVHKMIFDVMALVVMRYPRCRHREYYLDKKRLLDNLCDIMCSKSFDYPVHKRKRIAICGTQLWGADYHLTKIISVFANYYHDMGYEVGVFVESKKYRKDEFFIDHFQGSGVDAAMYEESNRNMFHIEIPVIYDSGDSIFQRVNTHIKNVVNYSPDRVIYFGADNTLVTKVLFSLFPITVVPTVQFGSNAYYHAFVSQDKVFALEQNEYYPWIEKEDWIMEYTAPMIRPEFNNAVMKREAFGWKENDFIFVTVGNRLSYELENDFIDTVCQVLHKNADLKWVIVGSVYNEYVGKKYDKLVESRQIEYISYEKNLLGLYQIVDAYLNPDRLGGGTTIAWALIVGLPVITRNIGSAGRCWLGAVNTVNGDWSDMMKELIHLKNDNEYYRISQDVMRKVARSHDIANSCQQLLEITEKAIQIYNDYRLEGV